MAKVIREGQSVRVVLDDGGEIIERGDRLYCGLCIPLMKREKAEKLAAVGKDTLARMRRSPNDPARSAQARAKQSLKAKQHAAAIREWERTNGKDVDGERYERKILPVVQSMTVPALMGLTGLSQYYCWEIRKGHRNLHARHWPAILQHARSAS